MISFLHPNAAWFFLFLIPVIAAYLWKPAFRRITVPSLHCWKEKKGTETDSDSPCFCLSHFPFSFWISSGVIILLVTAMMTPFIPPQTEKAKREEGLVRILRLGPESIPLDRALDGINLSLVSITAPPSRLLENELLVVTGNLPLPPPEGNVLLVNPSDIAELSDSDSPAFTCRLSEQNREIMQLLYPSSFTKSIQFPIMTAGSIEHFRDNGVLRLVEKKEPHRLSLLLIIGAALILAFGSIYSLLRNWNE